MGPAEIRALARMLERLDYYRLLRVARDASSREIRAAYHRARREFHPDAFLSQDPELQADVDRIARRITESYVVLRDPNRRQRYDRGLEAGSLRLTPEAEGAKRDEEESRRGRTPNGRRFFALCVEEERRGDLARALSHLRMALTFEAGNPHFLERLADLEDRQRQSATR
ncbi:MAG: DnaJ domain-containing protein [Myxococcota bacterium]